MSETVMRHYLQELHIIRQKIFILYFIPNGWIQCGLCHLKNFFTNATLMLKEFIKESILFGLMETAGIRPVKKKNIAKKGMKNIFAKIFPDFINIK